MTVPSTSSWKLSGKPKKLMLLTMQRHPASSKCWMSCALNLFFCEHLRDKMVRFPTGPSRDGWVRPDSAKRCNFHYPNGSGGGCCGGGNSGGHDFQRQALQGLCE